MSSRTQQPRLMLRSPMQSTVQSVLVTGSLLLMVTWISAWLFAFDQPMVLAATLTIVITALAVIGLRLAWTNATTAMAATRQRTRPMDGANTPESAHAAPVDEATPLSGKRWSLDVFASIDAQRFAAVCETWFSWAGFDTRYESHRTHEGVDIWLHAARLPGPVAIVRCKHAQDKPVGLQEMREFQGVVSSNKTAHGTFTTTSTYTPEALQFAKEHGIEVVDGRALLRRILTRTRQSQQALLSVAYNGR